MIQRSCGSSLAWWRKVRTVVKLKKTVIAKCYKSKVFYRVQSPTFFGLCFKRLSVKKRTANNHQPRINIVRYELGRILLYKESFVSGLWALVCFTSLGVNLLSSRRKISWTRAFRTFRRKETIVMRAQLSKRANKNGKLWLSSKSLFTNLN